MHRLPVALLLAALAASLLATAPASAQPPPLSATPTSTLELEFGSGIEVVPLGGSGEVPITVSFGISNLVCTGPSSATVKLTLRDIGLPGVTAKMDQEELVFEIGAGASLGGGRTDDQQVVLTITVAEDAPPQHEHSFNVTASYDGGTPAGCVAGGPVPAAGDGRDYKITTGKPPETVDNPLGGIGATPTAPTPEEKDSPGAGPLFVLGLLGLAFVSRRRD